MGESPNAESSAGKPVIRATVERSFLSGGPAGQQGSPASDDAAQALAQAVQPTVFFRMRRGSFLHRPGQEQGEPDAGMSNGKIRSSHPNSAAMAPEPRRFEEAEIRLELHLRQQVMRMGPLSR